MSHGYQNRRICAVQAFCAAKSWRRWDSLPPSILITLGLSRLRRVKQKTRRVARHKRFRFAKTLVHKQFICLCAVKCPTDTKKKSTALRCSSFCRVSTEKMPFAHHLLYRSEIFFLISGVITFLYCCAISQNWIFSSSVTSFFLHRVLNKVGFPPRKIYRRLSGI